MKRLAAIFCLLLTALTVQANDEDVHLRVMAHLARASGFDDATAKYLALSNQYVDMNAMSSAMLTPAQRQLWHFPGSLEAINVEGHGPIGILQRMGETKLALAERNHPLANYLIYRSLQTGDLQLLGFGFHVKMDGTGAHVGYSNLFGHLVDGHNPDRVFLEPNKFENMVRSLVQSLVQVRHMMPEEFQDKASALKYLNTYAKKTYLGRDLTEADLNDPVLLSNIILADETLQKIAREDMFKKYEYKLLALNKIFKNFKDQGIIHHKFKFKQVFPERLIRDTRLDVIDIVKLTATHYIEAVAKGEERTAKMFDLKKLLKTTSTESFLVKLEVERRRFLERLKAYRHEYLKIQSQQMNDVVQEKISPIMESRMQSEAQALLIGLDVNVDEFLANEKLIEAQAEKLSYHRVAEDFALQLTKDFVPADPRKYDEYIKQNFEGETDNRLFEVRYKEEAYRRFYAFAWGANWILEETTLFQKFMEAAARFRMRVFGLKNSATRIEMWERLADRAAEKLFEGLNTPSAELAQRIRYNFKNEINAMIKMAKYTLPALVPFYGYFYVQKILDKAQMYAKQHEVEDMKTAKENGKYKVFDQNSKSKAALEALVEIRKGTRLQCSYLFH